jgi:hypothetical protein
MGDDALRQFLEKVVLDDTFRELASSDPDRAFEGFDLTDWHREVLRRQDHEVLALLGEVLRDEKGSLPQRVETGPTSEPTGTVPDLDEAQLVVHLRPYAHQDEQGAIQLTYAASIHQWPAPAAEPGMVSFLLRVMPQAALAAGGQLHISYAAMIQPAPRPGEDPPPPGPPVPQSSSGPLAVPSEVVNATDAVRAASPEDRYQRLLDLIEALQR